VLDASVLSASWRKQRDIHPFKVSHHEQPQACQLSLLSELWSILMKIEAATSIHLAQTWVEYSGQVDAGDELEGACQMGG
jgi:hypothetical protein